MPQGEVVASGATRRRRLEFAMGYAPASDSDGQQREKVSKYDVVRAEVTESLGQPFVISVDVRAQEPVDFRSHLGGLGTLANFEFDGEEGHAPRYFNGLLVEAEVIDEGIYDDYVYRLILRPWTYFLSQGLDYNIYAELTVVDILKKVFESGTVTPFVSYEKIAGNWVVREYCVQYRESDFNFASRLMEEEGIYYFFKHEKQRHVLVLCESPSSHGDSSCSSFKVGVDLISWKQRVVSTGHAQVKVAEFIYEEKAVDIRESAGPAQNSMDRIITHVWPGFGKYHSSTGRNSVQNERFAKVLLESQRAARVVYSGVVFNTQLAVGTKITVDGHQYLVIRSHHVLSSETSRSGQSGDQQIVYFDAIPANTQWRSPIVTPRPVVYGPETAIITGGIADNGNTGHDSIGTDRLARVKVKFHWGGRYAATPKPSCWIRVSQTGHLGNMILPRVGDEVIVAFLDGDPDRPIVVGRVYSGKDALAYDLPKDDRYQVWRSRSLGGASYTPAITVDNGDPRSNEVRFDDKEESEELYLHAQRDMTVRVRRSVSEKIGLDQKEELGGSRDVDIKQTDKLHVGQTIEVEAGTKITLKVGSSEVVIDQTSVTIKTTQFKVEATGTADMKAPMTTVKADATLTLKGGMTLIN